MGRKTAALIFAGALFTTLLPVSMAQGAIGDNPCWSYTDAERGFARKTNSARANAGLRKLSLDPELSKAARVHTNEMIRKDELFHTSSTDLRQRVTAWTILGENVGVGSTVDSLQKAFMDSPAHRDNILLPDYRHVGIGAKKANGRLWVTIIFEDGADPGTTLAMPRC